MQIAEVAYAAPVSLIDDIQCNAKLSSLFYPIYQYTPIVPRGPKLGSLGTRFWL